MSTKTVLPTSPKKPLTFKWRLLRITLYVGKLLCFLAIILYVVVSIVAEELFTRSPNRTLGPVTPADYGLSYTEATFPAAIDNIKLKGWFISEPSDKVIIVLHGKNADRTAFLEPAVPLAKNGFNLLLFDFRAEGLSEGTNLSLGYYEQRDVLGAVAFLKASGFKPEHIGILGYSMGASTGLMAMSQTRDIKAMVADSAFANLGRELEYALPALTSGLLPPFFLPGVLVASNLLHGVDINGVRPEEAVKNLNGRHLFLIQGDQDGLVPSENIYRLKAAAGNAAEMWVVPGAGHVQSYNLQPKEYVRRVLAFFQREL